MTMQSPVQPPAMLAERRRLQQSNRCQQSDLFDTATPTQTPAWQDLPEETRATLTDLMTRLIVSDVLRPPFGRMDDGRGCAISESEIGLCLHLTLRLSPGRAASVDLK